MSEPDRTPRTRSQIRAKITGSSGNAAGAHCEIGSYLGRRSYQQIILASQSLTSLGAEVYSKLSEEAGARMRWLRVPLSYKTTSGGSWEDCEHGKLKPDGFSVIE
jgi:hypothetical protein